MSEIGEFGRIADAFLKDRGNSQPIRVPGFSGKMPKNSPEGRVYLAALDLRSRGEGDRKIADGLGFNHPNYPLFAKMAEAYIHAADSITRTLEELGKKLDESTGVSIESPE